MSRGWLGVLAVVVVLGFAPQVQAWGPLTHVHLATDVLEHLALLPASVAALLAAHRRYFIYGNVAADVVFAKKLSRIKQICHTWSTGFALHDQAESDAARAFALGYLSHLAADTVAHNKFLPRQIVAAGSTVTLGHMYWEIRADATLPRNHGGELQALLKHRFTEPERLMRSQLTRTLLPYRLNRSLFTRMNLLQCARSWRHSVRFAALLSRWPMDPQTLGEFHAESLERIRDVLARGTRSAVLHDDPNGNSALLFTRHQRRLVRRLQRAHLPTAQVIRETVLNHAPAPAGGWRVAADPPSVGNIVS